MRDATGRLQLKSKLLVSAAGIAAAAMSTAAAAADAASSPASSPPADPPKWSPYADIGGGIGSGFVAGKVNVFAPVWQDLDSLLFVRLGADTSTRYNENFNVGLGYRTKINPDWILGVFGGFDSTQANNNHSFTQVSLGAELMSTDWDVRVNGYSAKKDESAISNKFALYIHDTTIAILQAQYGAYSGFDGEVGYRIFNTDNTDVRVFAGGYDFSRSDTNNVIIGGNLNFSHKDIAGAHARAEVNVFSIDALGPQSRVSFDGEVAHDDVRGTTGYVGATLRIALNDLSGGGAQSLDDLDRRMVDPVRRQDDVLVRQSFDKPEPVIIYNGHITSSPTNTLYYVDNTAGAGSYANPTTLQDATSRGPKNQFIVLTDRNGPVNSTGVVVQSGESVVGPGVFDVRGVNSGTVFSHDFAPGSGPVSLFSTGPVGITVDSYTNLFGFTINAPFTDAIYGHNVTGVVISGITIDGTAGGVNGIHIVQDVSGNSTIDINDSTITNVSNDGIYINNAFSDGGTSNEDLHLDNVTISGSGNDGVYVNSNITGGSSATLNTELTSSSISGSGAVDVLMSATVGVGSSATQNIIIDPTTITGGLYGVEVIGSANGGTLNQYVDVSDVTFTGQTIAGLAVFAYGQNGATVNQTLNVTDVSVAGSYFPIAVIANAVTGASVTQNFSLTDVTVTGGTYDGIDIVAHADGVGSVVHQYGTMDDVTVTGTVFGDGVYAYAEATYGATTIARLNISNLTATGNYEDGLYVGVYAGSFTANASTAAQYVSVTNSNLSGNFIGVEADAGGIENAAARQDLTISNSTISGNGFYGIDASSFAAFSGASEQNVNLFDDTVDSNGFGGASFGAEAFDLGSAEQNIYIEGGSFSDNGGDGISIDGTAFFAGQVSQTAGIYYVTATGNAGDGLRISTDAYGYAIGTYAHYSHVGQNIVATYDNFSHNARNGVEIQNYAGYGAQVNQFVYLYGDHLDHNGPASGPIPTGAGNGLYEHSVAESYGYYGGAVRTNLYADLYVYSSTANGNAVDGLRVKGLADGPTYLIQHINVFGTDANGNGRAGFVAYANASNFYSLNIQYISLTGSSFDGNALDGAAFLATQHYGPLSFGAAIQDVTISGSDFSYNANDGLFASAEAYDFQGRAEQHFSISGSRFDDNGADGAHFYNNAHNGVYLTGYDCNYVQGLTGGCAFVRQTVTAIGSDFSYNGGDGIFVGSLADTYGAVYASSGRPLFAPTLLLEYSTANNNGGDGLHIENQASNYSYIYSYAVLLGSQFNNNGNHGIEVNSTADTGSLVLQKTILYGVPGYATTASGNSGDGLHVYSTANGGTVQQLVGIYNSDLSGNTGNGVYVGAKASGGSASYPSVIGQYINLVGSTFTGNAVYGAAFNTNANGVNAVTSQQISIEYSTVSGNGGDGVNAFAIAYNGASANQNLYFAGDTISNNTGDGVDIVGVAVGQAFTNQTVEFGYHTGFTTYVDGNGGDGIYVGTAAFSAGNIYQSVLVYDVEASHNHGNGLSIVSDANGYGFGSAYIYYSHVSQNVIVAYDSFTYNHANGVKVSNITYYGGVLNQLVELFDVNASHNDGAGFYDKSSQTSVRGNSFAFSTNQTSDVYLINSTLDHNGANGIDLESFANGAVYAPAFFGGYSYLIQHIQVSGSEANYNGGAGLLLNANQSGRYSLNAQYLTISGSEFDNNTGDGAKIVSNSYYGPGGFGDTFEQVTISGSDFSHNGGDGIYLGALSSGRQGRAEQHVSITGSTFDYNTQDGVHVYASAINGTYIAGHACATVQGLAGGCAFVRQNVTIEYSDISHNGNDGVDLITYANNYGAIYGASGRPHAPTLELYGTTVDYNNNRGLNVSNHVSGNSYLYQYIAAIDSNFDHNHSDGVYAASYVGGASTMLQRALLYAYHTGASASYNAGNGFKSSIEALGGSYARDVNIVQGADLSNDGSFGFDGAVAYADGSSTGLQINAIYFNSINFNGDGVGLYSIGAGAQQISYIGGNTITHNAFVGVYGEANFGAFQYIGVYTFGNTVNSNGTDYLFNSFGGATQILN